MEKHENTSKKAALRQKAEELLKTHTNVACNVSTPEAENQKYIFEMEVHQIELELQNEELCNAKAEAEAINDKYIRLYDLAPSGYFSLSRNGEIIELNLAGALMLGKERSHLINKNFHFFVSNETNEVFKLFLQKSFKNNRKESCEVTLTTSGNHPVYVHLSGIAIEGESKCFINAVDLTERKNAELGLRKEAERNSLLLGLFAKAPALSDKELYDMTLDIAVKITDSKIGFFHQVSDNQQEIILTTWNDEAKKNCTSVFNNHYPLDKAGNWADCIRQKKTVIYNDYPTSPNNKGLPKGHVPVDRTMSIPVVHDGKVRLIFGVGNKPSDYNELDEIQIQAVADELYKILEKRKVEKDLQNIEDRWQFAIQGSNDGIWEWNLLTGEVFFSNRWKEMIGYGPDELEGKLSEWQSRVHPDDIKTVKFNLQQHFEKKTPVYAAECRIRCKDGSWKWILDRGKVLEWTSDGKPSRLVGTHTNITDQKTAIEEIRWRNDDLQLMNAVTYAANHDANLDSILNIISDQLKKSFNSHSLTIHLPDENTGEFLMHSNTLDNALLHKIKKLTGRELPQIRLKINGEHPFSEIERSGKGLLVTGNQAIVNRLSGYLKGTNWPSLVQNLIKKILPSLCKLLEYQSAVAVPMITNGKTIGFLELGSRNIMTDHDLTRIQSIADHFAAVIVRSEYEKKLRESEVQYRNLANTGSALIWKSGTDKLCNYFNETWLRFTGRTLEQELGNGWAEGVHPEDFNKCLETYISAFDKQEPFEMEYRLRHSSGEYRWILDLGTPNYNSTGVFVGYIGHCFDISERKANETALKKLSQAVQQSPVMVYITDLNGNLEYANPKATELTGYTLEELAGQNPRILNSGEQPNEEYRILWETLKSGKEWRGEFHNKKKNGELFWSAASISP
ncbi:MAG: PAS domain S-box protein, partial [Bacteroidota bacterium]